VELVLVVVEPFELVVELVLVEVVGYLIYHKDFEQNNILIIKQ
jgi:hypothetical protein